MAGKNPKNHISFSELMNWRLCPLYHKLANIDDLVPVKGSEDTCFGTAIHAAIEDVLNHEVQNGDNRYFERGVYISKEALETFWGVYNPAIKELQEQLEADGRSLDTQKCNKLSEAARDILIFFLDELHRYLPGYELVKTEHELMVPIEEKILDHEYRFKGFIDLILRCGDEYHLIDWKTCSWGWDAKKKAAISKTYQLVLYKHFYSLETGIPLDKIHCHFGLLKKNPGKGSPIELFEVKIGKKKIQNALELLSNALRNIHVGNFIKNFSGCKHEDRYGVCPFANTQHCSKKL